MHHRAAPSKFRWTTTLFGLCLTAAVLGGCDSGGENAAKPKPEVPASMLVSSPPSSEDIAKKFMETMKRAKADKADEAKGPAMQQQQKLPEFNPKWIQQKAE